MIGETSTKEQLSHFISQGNLVKVCGLREPEHAVAAVEAGADFIGFIFAPARRQVTAATARSCVQGARAAGGRKVMAIGVFVDASIADVVAIVEEAGLDAVQLNGAEPPDSIESLPVPALKALRPTPESTRDQVLAEIKRYQSVATPPVGVIIDGYDQLAAGGTGTRADWALAAETNAVAPIILAGGLNPENVGNAIRRVRPRGVDVSSGVEVGGVKHPELIAQFVRAARAAFQDEVN